MMRRTNVPQALLGLLLLGWIAAELSCGTPASPGSPDAGSPSDAEEGSSARYLPGVPVSHSYGGNEIQVSTPSELQEALLNAEAGDVVRVASGSYAMPKSLFLRGEGSADRPIVLVGVEPRQAVLSFSPEGGVVEGLVIDGAHWIIDGLELKGGCAADAHSQCEHGIHVKAGAENLKVRNNVLHEFNAAIKGSGRDNAYADDVVIEQNKIFNEGPRSTSNPVTPIDINGGERWRVVGNFIYDFAKGGGDRTSYGAFLKANSSDGLFEGNLVRCQNKVVSDGARIALSFGGGGNAPIDSPICRDSDCSHLHRRGTMRNNLIADCSDVGIYINASSDVQIQNNTLLATQGIDVRFATSTAQIVGNILSGGDLSERNQGTITSESENTLAQNDGPANIKASGALIEKAQSAPSLDLDICGHARQSLWRGAVSGDAESVSKCLADLDALRD